jgi:MYXO-CTERM domain-containing protein
VRFEIDLDADVQDIYYDGNLLSSKSWTDGVSGGGALNIGAVDIFANGASPIYWDDMSLVPTPGALALLGAGLLGARRRRR